MAIRVLVVDDNVALRTLLVGLLTTDDLAVHWEAGDAVGALAIASAERPDAIVLDEHLPDGTGTSILPELRALVPHARIVVFTSDDSIAALALALGADGFVGKGAPVEELITELAG